MCVIHRRSSAVRLINEDRTFNLVTNMEDDMMEMYDGSTESDEDRFLAPLGDSYDMLVVVPIEFSLMWVETSTADQG